MCKVLLDSDEYLQSYGTLINSIRSGVHDMTSQVVPRHLYYFFQLCLKSSNLNSSGTRRDIKKPQTAISLIFKGLSDGQ